MLTLGLNAFHADASAALFHDGRLVAAIEEERCNRVKHCAGFPALAAREVLRIGGAQPGDLDQVAISRDPSANLMRKVLSVLGGGAPTSMLKTRLANAGQVRAVDQLLAEALSVPSLRAKVHNVEHHRAHLASAFFASPFDDAAVISIDAFGDFVSTMWARGRGNELEVLGQIGYPHSLGIFYTATTQWLGFPKYGDEGKVMGLAPYGEPRFAERMRRAVRLLEGGRFELDTSWFTHATQGARMVWDAGTPTVEPLWSSRYLEELGPTRAEGAELTDLQRDGAASLQLVTEEAVFHLVRGLQRRTGCKRLCLAGGVALNSVANGKLRAETGFDEVFVQPAAGDNGTSLGAALFVEHALSGRPRKFVMTHASFGPEFDGAACEAAAARVGLDGAKLERVDDPAARSERAARAIAGGKVVGWFQGRMEFGPRALGNRSVLADPRNGKMKEILNARIKHREPFRPFAPAVLAERAGEWFDDAQPSPAMLMVLPFRADKRAQVPAVAHVDGSGRLQTVARDDNPAFYDLIREFDRQTGVPIVLNTSFNENEPIVCTPDEALQCFRRTGIDLLVLGPLFIERERAGGGG